MAETVLAAGADVNEPNDRGWTALHQVAYSNQREIAAELIAHGDRLELEGHGCGWNAAGDGVVLGPSGSRGFFKPAFDRSGNLRVAAGLGRLDLTENCFRGERTLTAEACAARGFYRPHSGFPDWSPSADAQEVLDEALVWAAKSGRTEVLPRLLHAGARLDADPYRGTALIWAAVRNRLETAEWLIDHGANVNQRGDVWRVDSWAGCDRLTYGSARRTSGDGAIADTTRRRSENQR